MRHLQDYEPFLRAVFDSICERSELRSEQPLEEILRNPKLIVTLNHATAISWVPAISYLTCQVVKAGGGDRLSIGVMDKFLFSNPLTLPLAEYITQSRSHRSFEQLLDEMNARDQMDLVLFPEGAHTFFGDMDEIHHFRSARFIEMSIRTRAPLLLAVHRGSEAWNYNVKMPNEWGQFLMPFAPFFAKGLLQFGSLNLPVQFKKIPRFTMALRLYQPALFESDLSEHAMERRHQLETEAEEVRQLMQEMWDSLPASP